MKTLYSVGFAVSEDGARVLLLEKGRPAALKGKWMGVGGHMEINETPYDAIVRESKEEADLDVLSWERIGIIERDDCTIYMHAAFVDLDTAKTMTDEPVMAFTWEAANTLPLSDATEEIWESVQSFANRNPKASPSYRP